MNYWPVFVGYGLPLGVLVSLPSGVFQWNDMIVALLYPLLVVGAFQVPWNKGLDPQLHMVSPSFRVLAYLTMIPALCLTNFFISIIPYCSKFFR